MPPSTALDFFCQRIQYQVTPRKRLDAKQNTANLHTLELLALLEFEMAGFTVAAAFEEKSLLACDTATCWKVLPPDSMVSFSICNIYTNHNG